MDSLKLVPADVAVEKSNDIYKKGGNHAFFLNDYYLNMQLIFPCAQSFFRCSTLRSAQLLSSSELCLLSPEYLQRTLPTWQWWSDLESEDASDKRRKYLQHFCCLISNKTTITATIPTNRKKIKKERKTTLDWEMSYQCNISFSVSLLYKAKTL